MIRYGRAGKEDLEPLFSLLKEQIDGYEDLSAYPYEKVMDWVRRNLEQNIHRYRTIFYEGEKAGYFLLHQEGELWQLDDFYLLPRWRGKGIGTQVLQECMEKCSGPVSLYVFVENTKAVALYTRLGFRIQKKIAQSRYFMVQPEKN